VTCARPLTTVYYRLLGRDRVTFLQRHRRQVTALEALARRTMARTGRPQGG
jgi:hypothetical protein